MYNIKIKYMTNFKYNLQQVNPDPDPELIKAYKEANSKQLVLLDKYIHDNYTKENFAVGKQV